MSGNYLLNVEGAPSVQPDDRKRLYRLHPQFIEPSVKNRTVAFVAAHSDAEARLFAYESDPFYVDWLNTHEFVCAEIKCSEGDTIGDVTFISEPLLPAALIATG